jgi:hypothetical protein
MYDLENTGRGRDQLASGPAEQVDDKSADIIDLAPPPEQDHRINMSLVD